MARGGTAALIRKGIEVAHQRASESSGKAAAKNAKIVEEERLAHAKVLAAWKLALVPWNKYVTEEKKFFDAGNYLPFVIPPPNPGPGPGPFVSSAERNRAENEARAAANKAKMAALMPSNSSASAPLPPAGPTCTGLAIMAKQAAREAALIRRAEEDAKKMAISRLRRLGYKLTEWAQYIHRIETTAIQLVQDEFVSLTQRNKWRNILKFFTLRRTRIQDTTRPYVRPDLAMINYDVPMSKYREDELQVAFFFLQMPIFTDRVGRTKSFIMHFKFNEFSVRSK
jgi:hypothetical protein